MEFRILTSFIKDLKDVKDKKLLDKVKETTDEIKESVSQIDNEDEIPFKVKDTTKIKGSENSYRTKVDDSYRIGSEVDKEEDEQTHQEKKFFSLKRFLHHKDIYQKFP